MDPRRVAKTQDGSKDSNNNKRKFTFSPQLKSSYDSGNPIKQFLKKANQSSSVYTYTMNPNFNAESSILPSSSPQKITKALEGINDPDSKTINNSIDEDEVPQFSPESSPSITAAFVAKPTVAKTNLQKRIEGKVKSILNPFYNNRKINKEEYKEVLRKSVPKICQSKSRDYSQTKIKTFVLAYVKKISYCSKNQKKHHQKKAKYTPAFD